MICVIDNYDSFTYNIVQIFLKKNYAVTVFKNDEITVKEIKKIASDIQCFVFSPGPGAPKEAVLCHQILKYFAETKPVLGICLGHQVIAEHYGGKVSRANKIMHGKISQIYHDKSDLFRTISSPFQATRYNSLLVDQSSLPEELTVSCWTETDGGTEIMGLAHKSLPIIGFQFHPESILSEHGEMLIDNFLRRI